MIAPVRRPEWLAELSWGSPAVVVALALAASWLGWKLWQKYRFRRLQVPMVTPADLLAQIDAGVRPLILDLRGASMVAEHDRLAEVLGDWPKDAPIITLCACPEDAGAIQAARRLLGDGYLSVRALAGGYEAWQAAGGLDQPER